MFKEYFQTLANIRFNKSNINKQILNVFIEMPKIIPANFILYVWPTSLIRKIQSKKTKLRSKIFSGILKFRLLA